MIIVNKMIEYTDISSFMCKIATVCPYVHTLVPVYLYLNFISYYLLCSNNHTQ